MFICDSCGEAVGPKISPIKVIAVSREAYYENRVDGETKVTKGSEIVEENQLCHACAGLHSKTPAQPDLALYARITKAAHIHAGNCKKSLEGCAICSDILSRFEGFNLQVLSSSLEDRMVRPFTQKIGAVAVENMMDRTHHETSRAKADVNATYEVMGPYAKRGGTI